MDTKDLHLCEHEGCTAIGRHYDNCPTCFGFGMAPHAKHSEELVPVAVLDRYWSPAEVVPCPFCGSTLAGAPTPPATRQ